MTDFGKMIDKLIEISTNQDISDEVKCNLDDVIDELIHLEIENNGEKLIVPDFSDLSPEEMEEIKQFELFVRDVMNNKLALA
mgnify:FL=1